MNYKWEKCSGSTMGRPDECTNCLNWLLHIQLEPNCKCNKLSKKTISLQNNIKKIIESSINKNDSISCSLCGVNCNVSYPAYHIARSIISAEIPNAPVCEKCIH